MKLRNTEKTLAIAATKAGMDEKTARKWLRKGKLPSQCQAERNWRTRADPFEAYWEEIEKILKRAPTVLVTTLFDHLCRHYPGQFQEGQLRTLQRRVKIWRACNGEPQEVFFAQTLVRRSLISRRTSVHSLSTQNSDCIALNFS